MIIDFEYTGWQPRAMDIANFCNDAMIDNAYPLKNGMGLYLNNFFNDHEINAIITTYLTHYYDNFFKGNKDVISKEEF